MSVVGPPGHYRLKAVSVERERAMSGLAAAGEGRGVQGEEESDVSGSDMEDTETDATAVKEAHKKQQHSSYEDAGESDDEAARLPGEEGSEVDDGVQAQESGSEDDSHEGDEEGHSEKEVKEMAETAALDQDRVKVSCRPSFHP